jgi:hypothetical protein
VTRRHAPSCPFAGESSPRELNLDTIVELIHRQGIWAYVEQTGGGCATIYAGAQDTNREGDTIYAAIAGPGTCGWGHGPSIGNTGDFFIGADDQGETPTIDCAAVGALSEQAVADLIVAQAMLPLGAHLSVGAAERILTAAVERILAAAVVGVMSL